MSNATSWDDPILRVGSDSPRVSRYRRLQSWYRDAQLGVAEAGIGVNGKPVGSMLPESAIERRPDLNFLTPAAYEHARRRIREVRMQCGTLEEDRLRRNLLSSMPLCFNIFGSLGTHPSFVRLVRDLIDTEATDVVSVECEWAPQPPVDYLDDRSAFDAFICYAGKGGNSCFVGIETKYTEPFSPIEYDKPTYRHVTEESGWFKPGAFADLKASNTNQLWRTMMLAASMQDRNGYGRGMVALLTCADDSRAAECVETLQAHLVDPRRLLHLTFEQLAAAAREANDADLMSWAELFEQRYLGADRVGPERSPSPHGPKLASPLRSPDRTFESADVVSSALIEVFSWKLASRLASRHPDLRISEQHPGGGTYDCLTINGDDATGTFDHIHLNREGSAFVWQGGDWTWAWRGIWAEIAAKTDYEFATQILEHFAGLAPPPTDPHVQPHTICYDTVAAILQYHLGAPERWQAARNFGGETWYGLPVPDWAPNEDDCWILYRGSEPFVAIAPDVGFARRHDGMSLNVMDAYDEHRRTVGLVTALLEDASR